jgi:hypothetical protein
MRGFQYDAAEDPALGREVEASREHAIKVLTALFKLGDIIVQREVACSLVGFGERGYLKRVLECMMVEKTAFDQHKEYMKRIWRFDEEDQLKADRARRIAWSIIKSTRGFRTHLRAINVFSLAQFSHSVEDVADLERLKIEENTKPMRDRDRLLLKTIDYCVTLIQKETLPTSQDSNLRTKRP